MCVTVFCLLAFDFEISRFVEELQVYYSIRANFDGHLGDAGVI